MADRASSKLGASEAADTPPEPGRRIGDKFVVLQAIAEGGMGWVLAARHVDLDEIVAIKVLKRQFAKQPEIVARFAREAKASMQIRSDHCVRIMDVGSDRELGPFIVMEHLEGDNLGELIVDEGRLSPRRATDLLLQVCDGLAHAHVLGIVHRDVKPENVFVSRHGDMEVARVLDFGISKTSMAGRVFETELSLVKTQSLLGSPVYMSPEQMRAGTVDLRSDIWSVGTTLYEAVAGTVPFNAASVTEVCSLVLETEPTPLPDHVPPALAAVILKCLEKDPARRYQNVGELALALVPFAPSGSRLWAERVVSLLNAHGASLDASGLRSEPPPSMPSSRRLRGPASGSNSLPLALSMPTLASRPDDETAPDGRIPTARTTRPTRGSQFRAAAIGTLCALVVIGVVALRARRAWMPTRPVAPATEPARGDTLTDPAAAALPPPSAVTPTEPGPSAVEPGGAVATEPSASRPKLPVGFGRASGGEHAPPSASPAASSPAPVAASASSAPAVSTPTPTPSSSSSAAPPAASSGRPKILDDSKRPKLLE